VAPWLKKKFVPSTRMASAFASIDLPWKGKMPQPEACDIRDSAVSVRYSGKTSMRLNPFRLSTSLHFSARQSLACEIKSDPPVLPTNEASDKPGEGHCHSRGH